ncbi:ROK family protein [archaeon]|nr:ROK family protein [archaeon]
MNIGVDVGGTKIRTGLVKDGRVVKHIKVLTGADKGKKHVLKQIIKTIKKVMSSDVKGIGVGVPGAVDNNRARAVNLPNIPSLNKTNLKLILEKEFKKKVVLGNDSNAFTLAESVSGAGRGSRNVVGLTLGTGVGGGLVINQQIYTGKCCAGEAGHITINHMGRKCSCGGRGCLEEYVSARAITRYSKELIGRGLKPRAVEDKAREGDEKAVMVYQRAGEYLGAGLVTINNLMHPDLIIIGGGLSKADYLIIKPAREVLKSNGFFKPSKVVKAKLGSDAGVIGASYLTQPSYLST